jgi:hypothetical protein
LCIANVIEINVISIHRIGFIIEGHQYKAKWLRLRSPPVNSLPVKPGI